MGQSDLDRLRSAYQQWSDTKGGSVDTWLELVGDDIAFGSLAQGDARIAFTAPRSGRDDVRSYLESLNRDWQMVSFDMDRYVADGDTIVALGHCAFTNRQTGKTAETRKADVWTFRDGKAVSFYEFYDTASLYAAAEPD